MQVLLEKLLAGGSTRQRRKKLARILEEAAQHYVNSDQKERQAFFHGLLTGCALARKL